MSISGALSIQEVRAVLESLRDEMRPLVRNKAEIWKGEVVEVIGSSVRVARGDEPTTAGSLLRAPYPVVGSIPSVGAEVWAASWVGGGIVITGGTSGAVGVTSIEGQSGTVDIAGTGGISVSGTGGTVTIDGSGAGGGGGPSDTIEGVSNAGGNIDVVGAGGISVVGDNTANTITIDGSGVSGGGGGGSATFSRVVLGSDVATTSDVFSDVTGFSFPVTSGKRYRFRIYLVWTSTINTTGANFALNGPAFSHLTYFRVMGTTGFAGTKVEAYDTGVSATSANMSDPNTVTMDGMIVPSASGTVTIRHHSEISGSSISTKAGSMVEYWDATNSGSSVFKQPIIVASFADPLTARVGGPFWINDTYTIRRFHVHAATASSGAANTFLLKKNGSTIGTLSPGSGVASLSTADLATGVVDGDILTGECSVVAGTPGTKWNLSAELERVF